MSDILKCPYCGGILEQSSIFNLNSYACTDLNCKGSFMTAPKDMWQELIRTRKALDVALKGLDDIIDSGADGYWTAIKTEEQITALEQKE